MRCASSAVPSSATYAPRVGLSGRELDKTVKPLNTADHAAALVWLTESSPVAALALGAVVKSCSNRQSFVGWVVLNPSSDVANSGCVPARYSWRLTRPSMSASR